MANNILRPAKGVNDERLYPQGYMAEDWSAWRKNKTIQISGGTSGQTNYQIRFILHFGDGIDNGEHIYLGAWPQNGFSDIRFAKYSDGSDTNYWIEEVVNKPAASGNILRPAKGVNDERLYTQGYNNISHAIVWVEVPSIPTTSTKIILFYGNPETGTDTRIGVLTDIHIGAPSPLSDLTAVIDEWKANFRPHVGISCGDNARGNVGDTWQEHFDDLTAVKAEYDDLKAAPLSASIGICMGNHDRDQLSLSEWLGVVSEAYQESGKTYGYFDLADVRIIILDTLYNSSGVHTNAVPGVSYIPEAAGTLEQTFLTNALSGTNKKCLVFAHYGMALESTEGNPVGSFAANEGIANAAAIRTILENSGKVIGVFAGHTHWNRFRIINDIPYFRVNVMSASSGGGEQEIPGGGQPSYWEITVNSFRKTLTVNIYEGIGIKALEYTIPFSFSDAYRTASNPYLTFAHGNNASTSEASGNFGESGNWYMSDGTNGVFVRNTVYNEPVGGVENQQAIKCVFQNTTTAGVATQAIEPQTGKFRFIFRAQMTVTNKNVRVLLHNGDSFSAGNSGPVIVFRKTGQIAYDDGTLNNLQAYSADTWYELELLVDVVSKTFDINIDGTSKGTGIGFLGGGVSSINRIMLRKSSGADSQSVTAYFDDIRIQEYAGAGAPAASSSSSSSTSVSSSSSSFSSSSTSVSSSSSSFSSSSSTSVSSSSTSLSPLPTRVSYNDLWRLYHVGHMKFDIEGTSLMWRDNQLIELVTGDMRYILRNNVMVLV